MPPVDECSILPLATTQQLADAREIIRDEASALECLAANLNAAFCDAVELLKNASGNVVVTGVGKAGLIGQKIVATLSSTGTRSLFLHPTEAMHGDLGCVSPNDVVLAISNSGRSEEVVRLIPILNRRSIPVIAVTRDSESQLAASADIVLEIGRYAEAGELKLAPSVSTTAMLALGDALALVVSKARGFTKMDFADSHPAGNLGRQFQSVAEVMRTEGELRVALESESVRSVMIDRSRPGRRTGAVLLTDHTGCLSGIFTDSDLARLFEQRRDHMIDRPIAEVMSENPTTIHESAMLPQAVEIMKKSKISELPVVNHLGAPVGLVDITDVIDVVPVSQPSASKTSLHSRAA
ncbi:UNVERIFIED_CONTAM: hypothetical protein GTU68_044959 [Idotea baltica]|nr:hypothetical protein [Idotea baltica]